MSKKESGQLWPATVSGAAEVQGPSETITAFCDGGARGNPGPAGYGVAVEGPRGEILAELSGFLGIQTNNFAEYSGLLAALDYALEHGHGRLKVVSDSELMVKQVKGQYKVKSPELRSLYDEAKRRIAKLDGFHIEHVLRGKNKKADLLANQVMDKGMGRQPASNHAAAPPSKATEPQTVRGFVKNGVVHFLEGELPDGVFVKVVPDRQ
jgi:ribonuclease HI